MFSLREMAAPSKEFLHQAALCIALSLVPGAGAQQPAEAHAYVLDAQVSGTLRIWGHGNPHAQYMGDLLRAWEEGFRKVQPQVRFENGMTGNASAIGGLFTGAADISFMDREIWATELDAFQQGTGHNPYSVAVATGSLARPNHAPALVIFVNRDNPLTRITLAQLDAIFGADHRRSQGTVRTWGQLGLKGEWAAQRIHPYGYGILRRQSQYFEHEVLMGSQKWNCDLREFSTLRKKDGSILPAPQQILAALAKDRYGIAFATLEFDEPGVKSLAIAQKDGDAPVAPTQASVASRAYPLAQTLYAYIDRAPGKELDPSVKEFLAYVLSSQGQQILKQLHGYLPLTDAMVKQQREKLQ